MTQPHTTLRYDNSIIQAFLLATVSWGMLALLVCMGGAQHLNILREMSSDPSLQHTFVFAFAGNVGFAGLYYSTQRLLRARIFSDFLSWFHFAGWQTVVALAFGLRIVPSTSYSDLLYSMDLAICIITIAFLVNFFGMMIQRKATYTAIVFQDFHPSNENVWLHKDSMNS